MIFITGGTRSGKSAYAQRRALELAPDPVYVATARILDQDFRERVSRHQQDRGPEWTSFEADTRLHLLPLQGRVAVIDCVTLWLTNFFLDHGEDTDRALSAFKAETDLLLEIPCTLLIISNELGMGMHADTPMGRKFADLQGWANQYLAARAREAIFVVSGIPLSLKS